MEKIKSAERIKQRNIPITDGNIEDLLRAIERHHDDYMPGMTYRFWIPRDDVSIISSIEVSHIWGVWAKGYYLIEFKLYDEEGDLLTFDEIFERFYYQLSEIEELAIKN